MKVVAMQFILGKAYLKQKKTELKKLILIMKNLKTMSVTKYIVFFIFLFSSFLSFSQKKEDVYFVMNKNNDKYIITGNLNNLTDYITIYNRKEYEYHQKKVKEAKKKGTYYFNSESGRDNLNIHVSKLTFEIISKKKK